MDEEKKKIVMIVVAIACIVLAVVITFATYNRGPKTSTGPIPMLCINPDCGASFELSRDEYSEQLIANQSETTMRGMGGRRMAGPSAFTCPDCGKKSAYMATKCPKCGAFFIEGQAGDQQFPDRCPECNYSAMEDISSR